MQEVVVREMTNDQCAIQGNEELEPQNTRTTRKGRDRIIPRNVGFKPRISQNNIRAARLVGLLGIHGQKRKVETLIHTNLH